MKRLLYTTIFLSVLLTVVPLTFVRGTRAHTPADPVLIVYRRNVAEPPYVVADAVDPSTGVIQRLSWQGKQIVNHACSIDGQSMAFITEDEGLFVLSGGEVASLRAPQRLSEADLDVSNGGRSIAFSTQGAACCGTFVIETETGAVTRVRDGFYHSFSPSFTPRGDALALAADVTRYLPQVFIMPLAPESRPQPLGPGTGPQWSPSGHVLALNGITLLDIATRLRVSISSDNDIYPAWSPDGSLIAYLAYHNRRYDLAVMRWNGADRRLLTSTPEMEHEACFLRDIPVSLLADDA